MILRKILKERSWAKIMSQENGPMGGTRISLRLSWVGCDNMPILSSISFLLHINNSRCCYQEMMKMNFCF